MHSSPTSAGGQDPSTEWRTCNPDALAALTRRGSIRIEPAPWLTPQQACRLHDLVDDLLTYQGLYRLRHRIPNGYRALQSQGQEIVARLAELADAGVQLRWRSGSGDTAVHLACRPG